MNAVPVSVVKIKVRHGWIAYVRYEDRMRDQDITAVTSELLDRKIDYLFRPLTRAWR